MLINLTQHAASADQKSAGVVDLQNIISNIADNILAGQGDPDDYLTVAPDQSWLSNQLTFTDLPSAADLNNRAGAVVAGLKTALQSDSLKGNTFMLGGAPFFMPVLANALALAGAKCVYAFSQRVSVDNADGTKVSVFKHLGFVPHV